MPEVTTDNLQRMAFEKIWHFSTSVLVAGGGHRLNFRGSGSFVAVANRRCLLTAAHVWDSLSRFPHPEVAFSVDGRHPAIPVRRDTLTCLHSSPKPQAGWGEWGPDLALIELPPSTAGSLEAAGKTFYDLDRRREEALTSDAPPGSGLWFAVGALGETVEYLGTRPDGGPEQLRLDAVALRSTVHSMHTVDGLDFVDLSLYDKRTNNFPEEYGGLSGSGVWRAGEHKGDNVEWDGRSPFLEGVVYWYSRPTEVENEIIRCHGRRSVYGHLMVRAGLA